MSQLYDAKRQDSRPIVVKGKLAKSRELKKCGHTQIYSQWILGNDNIVYKFVKRKFDPIKIPVRMYTNCDSAEIALKPERNVKPQIVFIGTIDNLTKTFAEFSNSSKECKNFEFLTIVRFEDHKRHYNDNDNDATSMIRIHYGWRKYLQLLWKKAEEDRQTKFGVEILDNLIWRIAAIAKFEHSIIIRSEFVMKALKHNIIQHDDIPQILLDHNTALKKFQNNNNVNNIKSKEDNMKERSFNNVCYSKTLEIAKKNDFKLSDCEEWFVKTLNDESNLAKELEIAWKVAKDMHLIGELKIDLRIGYESKSRNVFIEHFSINESSWTVHPSLLYEELKSCECELPDFKIIQEQYIKKRMAKLAEIYQEQYDELHSLMDDKQYKESKDYLTELQNKEYFFAFPKNYKEPPTETGKKDPSTATEKKDPSTATEKKDPSTATEKKDPPTAPRKYNTFLQAYNQVGLLKPQ